MVRKSNFGSPKQFKRLILECDRADRCPVLYDIEGCESRSILTESPVGSANSLETRKARYTVALGMLHLS